MKGEMMMVEVVVEEEEIVMERVGPRRSVDALRIGRVRRGEGGCEVI